MKAIKPREYTAGEITKYAIQMLQVLFKAKVWRQNQIPQRGRTFRGERGAADITGYIVAPSLYTTGLTVSPGTRIECEVKTLNDKLSPDQIKYMTEAEAAGVVCLVAFQDGSKIEILPFSEYITKLKK